MTEKDEQKVMAPLPHSRSESKKRNRKVSSTTCTVQHGRCLNVSERYEKLGRIGEGTYGIVYKARDKKTSQFVALKRCLPHNESSDGFPLTTLREIHSLRICSGHEHIVRLQDIAVSANGVFLVFDYCPHDLARLVDTHYQSHHKSPFRESHVKTLLHQLLSALDFMHSRRLIHRDVKLSNLLYSDQGSLKLADFGLSRKLGPSLTPKVVSLWYRPPELLLGGGIMDYYTVAVDLWGAGCVFGELLDGVPLLDGKNEMDQISKVFRLLGNPTVLAWPALREMPLIQNGTLELPPPTPSGLLDRFSHLSVSGLSLLSTFLKYDYEKRGTAAMALQSRYFMELPSMTSPELMPRFPSLHGR
jgi:serine/threonine protein kinase